MTSRRSANNTARRLGLKTKAIMQMFWYLVSLFLVLLLAAVWEP